MPAREREPGELPSPDLSLLDRKVGRGLFVSGIQIQLKNGDRRFSEPAVFNIARLLPP